MAQMLQKPVYALPGCQQMSVNTLSLCDTLGLAELKPFLGPQKFEDPALLQKLVGDFF